MTRKLNSKKIMKDMAISHGNKIDVVTFLSIF